MEKVRGRLVNFRVTNDEFEQLKAACDRQGARCLSDFLRKVVLTAHDANNEGFDRQLSVLNGRLSTLESSCRECSRRWSISSLAVINSEKQK